MGGCFGNSQIDRYLESQVLEYCGGIESKRYAKCLRVPSCEKGSDGVCYSGYYCTDKEVDDESHRTI